MKINLKAATTLMLLVALATACTGSAMAERELIDRVIAVVDEAAIFESEIGEMVKQLQIQQGMTSVTDAQRQELEQLALRELISSRLVLAKAERLGIQVPFSEIEQMVDNAIEENQRTLGGEAAFSRQLETEGLTDIRDRDGVRIPRSHDHGYP